MTNFMYGADAAYAELFNRPDWTGKSTSCSQAVNDMLALVKGNYTCNHPGYFTTIADNEAKPVGALHFAGEHTSSFYEFQGFMEGAALSGIRAANEVLHDIKVGAMR
jgi:hypothetical protein